MKRLLIICEGETEVEFVKKILYTNFLSIGILLQPVPIKKTRGGIVGWTYLKREIETHLKNDQSAFLTTFIDFYGLKESHQFPNWINSVSEPNKQNKVKIIEDGMLADIDSDLQHRFIPYIQLHEFESLLFIDQQVFINQIPSQELVDMAELDRTIAAYPNPELINDVKETSPSHRLERIIKGYNKVVYGNIIAESIGLYSIRQKAPRFNAWLTRLESL